MACPMILLIKCVYLYIKQVLVKIGVCSILNGTFHWNDEAVNWFLENWPQRIRVLCLVPKLNCAPSWSWSGKTLKTNSAGHTDLNQRSSPLVSEGLLYCPFFVLLWFLARFAYHIEQQQPLLNDTASQFHLFENPKPEVTVLYSFKLWALLETMISTPELSIVIYK